jgi:hypothetical protein
MDRKSIIGKNMKHKTLSMIAATVVSLLAASPVSALTFTATGTGPITAYFYGQTAGYGSVVGLRVNGVSQGIYGLYNHGTAPGTALVLGNANAGDTLEFELRVSTLDNGVFDYSVFSNPSLNADGAEHTVSSAFTAGTFGIPNGTFVGFEDILPIANSDFDFDDHQFVFTGVSNVPDAGSAFAMVGIAVAGLGMLRRKLS